MNLHKEKLNIEDLRVTYRSFFDVASHFCPLRSGESDEEHEDRLEATGWNPPEQAVRLFGSSNSIGVATVDVVPIEAGWTWDRPLSECARVTERVLKYFIVDKQFSRRTFIGICENLFSERVSAHKRFWRRLRIEQPRWFVDGSPLANARILEDTSMVSSSAYLELKLLEWRRLYRGVADVSAANPAELSLLVHLRQGFSWAVVLSLDDAEAASLDTGLCASAMAMYQRGKLGALDPRLLGSELARGRHVLFTACTTEHRGEALVRAVFACEPELLPAARDIGLDVPRA